MKWYEAGIKIYVITLEEPINTFLFQIGASGTYTEQKEEAFLIKGYIPEKLFHEDIHEKIEKFLKNLHSIFPETKKPDYYIKELKEYNWPQNGRIFLNLSESARTL